MFLCGFQGPFRSPSMVGGVGWWSCCYAASPSYIVGSSMQDILSIAGRADGCHEKYIALHQIRWVGSLG